MVHFGRKNSMINLYKNGLMLSFFALTLLLIAGNIRSDLKLVFEIKPILYICSAISFSIAFSFFSVVYLKSQSQNLRKRKNLRKK